MPSRSDLGRSAISGNVFLSVFLFSSVILAQSNSGNFGTFIFPINQGDNSPPSFNYLDKVNASWTSNWVAPWLHLWCVSAADPNNAQHNVFEDQSRPSKNSYTVSLNYAISFDRCHFQLTADQSAGSAVDSINSVDFTVAHESDRTPKVWTLSSPVDEVANPSGVSDGENEILDILRNGDAATTTSSTSTTPTTPISTMFISTSFVSTISVSETFISTFSAPPSPTSTSTSNTQSSGGLSIITTIASGLSCNSFFVALIVGAICIAWIQ